MQTPLGAAVTREAVAAVVFHGPPAKRQLEVPRGTLERSPPSPLGWREMDGAENLMDLDSMTNLSTVLTDRFGALEGDWVTKNSGYEGALAGALGWQAEPSRYWDARTPSGVLVEFKKGRSIWLDLVRFAEVILSNDGDANQPTVTLFFVPERHRSRHERRKIVEVLGLPTRNVIDALKLSVDEAHSLVALHRKLPRAFNAQARFTLSDVRRMALIRVAAPDA